MSTLQNLSVCGPLGHVHTDERRVIQEKNLPNSSYNMITVTGNTGVLGNHYHKRKTEDFFVVAGGGVVRVAPVDEAGTISGEVTTYQVSKNTVISIPPFHVHDFALEIGTVLLTHSSAPFVEGSTPEEKDFWSCKIPE